MKEKVFKILSRNDVGETGSHQSGMSIPKAVMETGIFPKLGTSKLNPRSVVEFYEEDDTRWEFQFIYYNDLFFGKPRNKAHDEYRLTCIIDLIRKNNIKSGDEIYFYVDELGKRRVGFLKRQAINSKDTAELNSCKSLNEPETEYNAKKCVLKLSGKWRSVKY